ncbi:hypothetical protein GP486_001563 [Trichoglossum hirsutum]|uniref:DUF7924 domain-containing protein n=1 Tax=Trichoglossum hirsutum TaxID=265104 RepID=A0A9P8RT02_9PEZI|nr:hypothetical protein GP486_001563 [Trichoglossum hirsutum]
MASQARTLGDLGREEDSVSMGGGEGAMLPPPPFPPSPPHNNIPSIKTPRPDITAGLLTTAVIKALESRGLNNTAAESLLKDLQQQVSNYRSLDLPPEPFLCSEPTQRALNIRFPFLIVEGKSYATGRSVYEAQNQAAVSGACALKILHNLATLEACAGGDNAAALDPRTDLPIVFSICTEGPYHELWCHYTTIEDGIRKYNMNIWKVCHGSLPDDMLDFLVAVDNVLRWGAGTFLDKITGQLGKVAEKSTWFASKEG